MFPSPMPFLSDVSRLPHVCGDVSLAADLPKGVDSSAPRMWRCFHPAKACSEGPAVCPTYVEMFLVPISQRNLFSCLLHVCGDVSIMVVLPCDEKASAPRMWRCFQGPHQDSCPSDVCSTYVEMFLVQKPLRELGHRLLHVCGDVSHIISTVVLT